MTRLFPCPASRPKKQVQPGSNRSPEWQRPEPVRGTLLSFCGEIEQPEEKCARTPHCDAEHNTCQQPAKEQQCMLNDEITPCVQSKYPGKTADSAWTSLFDETYNKPVSSRSEQAAA